MIDRQKFFADIKAKGLFKSLKQSQVDGINATLDEWEKWVKAGWVDNDLRKLAYILATDKHESADTMQAIKEYGGNAYYVKLYWTNQKKAKELGNRSAQDAIDYCGKGKPQITGRNNYAKMSKLLGYDLINKPDLMLNLKIATEVMFEGMLTGKSFAGDFTGKSLINYFNKTTNDPYNARRVINGIDKAKLIEGYHYKFLSALQ